MRNLKNIRTLISLIIPIIVVFACELETQWNVEPSEPVTVVDAIITSEQKQHRVKVYSSDTSLNGPHLGISRAEVRLIRDNEEWYFSESGSIPGLYISDSAFRAVTGATYALIVNIDGKTDTAYAEMTAITPLPDYNIVVHDSLYRFVYIDDDQPSMTDVYYNWSHDPEHCSNYGSCEALETFYSLNTIDANETFSPDRQVISFPKGTTIIRKKHTLSEEHQRFVRSLLLETDWRGGIFDVEQGNVPTNFNNGLRGWFGICMVLSDTIGL